MISIIIPVYNVERYLKKCIDSILRQTYTDYEVILIDDGSPDRCGEICEEYAKKDRRFRVFHTENKGLSAARNLGLMEANGEYIGFVDSDDWIEPDMYEVLLQRIEETGADISTCGIRNEYATNSFDSRINNGIYSGPEAIRALVCSLGNAVWNKLYKKICWNGIVFPEQHLFEDIATLYKVFLKAYSVSSTPKVLYHYRRRNNSITQYSTAQIMRKQKDRWAAVYGRYQDLSARPELRQDDNLINKLEEQVMNKALQTWGLMHFVPKDQRDYAFLYTISRSIKRIFPVFGKKDWSLSLRIKAFFPRFANEISFAFFYYLSKCCLLLKSPPQKTNQLYQ